MKGPVVVLLGLVIVGAIGASSADARRPVMPAIFVLGDSTLDVGNNNHLPGKDVPRANEPFYGIDFPGGAQATGRFSNGYNIADFVARQLGFERSPLAYLVLKSRNYLIPSALKRGVSYASAGSGILDSTNAGKNIPLSKQVSYFASTKAEMEAVWGSHKVTKLLASSFFLLGFGSNDLFQSRPKSQADVAALYATLVSNYSAAITDLYGMGARKFGIISPGPVGCVPRVRLLNATGACNDGMNRLTVGLAAAFKSGLATTLSPTRLPGLTYSLADSFAGTRANFDNPQAAGFMNADSACCGSGKLGAEGECMRNATVCSDRDAYAFFDNVHPSQRAAELGAQALFVDGPTQITTPISFKELAHQR
ncbi:GDSL esterase/lipase At4g28780 [Aegilops tauschii subsp. strangulata]|uniref:GDSL esterase/lipase n=4 Tax=Aegilops tauschii TaxID=37682 RepID=A0A453TAC1_AEGTS|nr:GDSL esterase/lipase At4g28780 [Aegilops tauschii subsp. strangulata]